MPTSIFPVAAPPLPLGALTQAPSDVLVLDFDGVICDSEHEVRPVLVAHGSPHTHLCCGPGGLAAERKQAVRQTYCHVHAIGAPLNRIAGMPAGQHIRAGGLCSLLAHPVWRQPQRR